MNKITKNSLPLLFKIMGSACNIYTIYILSRWSVDSQASIFIAFSLANMVSVFLRLGQGNLILKDSYNNNKMFLRYENSIIISFLSWLLLAVYALLFNINFVGVLASLPLTIINLSSSLQRAKRDVIIFSIFSSFIMPVSWLVILFGYHYFINAENYVNAWIVSLYFTSLLILIVCGFDYKSLRRTGKIILELKSSLFTLDFYRNLSLALIPFLTLFIIAKMQYSYVNNELYVKYEFYFRVMSFIVFPLYAILYKRKNISDNIIRISIVSTVIIVILTLATFIYYDSWNKVTVALFSIFTTLILFFYTVCKDGYFLNHSRVGYIYYMISSIVAFIVICYYFTYKQGLL
ncbi:membrane hypothetical protein [Vibrio chagasii]|uniref:hypothetical protein n=1 Tax=Vibrio chagasii TaxID=170679 RepID=UPI001EFD8916|nr:hypothetical protein [Vibrio chagasii]MCG9674493.1 hypothetical protein [Vibrio chagasii]CAH7382861.1 membrane hypothetical protein [Vibrio chagasii]CAH7408573.1 membrane hypothetical protein [Vibrio chagasii]CAH7415931.1 membrane hypothetical protein [Vibrio chagasii]CAH7427894.1 membrane hypothetical protein [Vibrio chagasii]